MLKHTPGKWSWSLSKEDPNKPVIKIDDGHDNENAPLTIGDLELIIHAPKMLSVLWGIAGFLARYGNILSSLFRTQQSLIDIIAMLSNQCGINLNDFVSNPTFDTKAVQEAFSAVYNVLIDLLAEINVEPNDANSLSQQVIAEVQAYRENLQHENQ